MAGLFATWHSKVEFVHVKFIYFLFNRWHCNSQVQAE